MILGKSGILVSAVLTLMALALSGCGWRGEGSLNSEQAKAQMQVAVETVQSATGTDWRVTVEPSVVGCSQTHGRWVTTWEGKPTSSRDIAFEDVAASLEEE